MGDFIFGIIMGVMLGAVSCAAIIGEEHKKLTDDTAAITAEKAANCAMWQYELNLTHDNPAAGPLSPEFRDLIDMRPDGCGPLLTQTSRPAAAPALAPAK